MTTHTAPLPAKAEALKRIAEARTWGAELEVANARSRRIAWAVACAGVCVGLAGVASATAVLLRPAAAPKVLVLDKTTGESMVLPSLDGKTVPQVVAMDLNNAAQYVVARESYDWALLQRDYDQVARMSAPEVFQDYARSFTGPSALHTKLKDTETRRVTVINARPDLQTSPGRKGAVVITYEREVRGVTTPVPVVSRHVATVQFEYRPGSLKVDRDRLWNPFGFAVTGYRTDAEVASSRVTQQKATP